MVQQLKRKVARRFLLLWFFGNGSKLLYSIANSGTGDFGAEARRHTMTDNRPSALPLEHTGKIIISYNLLVPVYAIPACWMTNPLAQIGGTLTQELLLALCD